MSFRLLYKHMGSIEMIFLWSIWLFPIANLGLTKLIQLILTESGAGGSGRGDEVTSIVFSARFG